jgi:predicted transposase YbfD/YdcC
VDWLFSDRRDPDEPGLHGLATLAMIESTTERDGRTSTVRRYYPYSATLSAARFAEAVRAYWRFESTLHWVLDTSFDEDRARNRQDHGPENLAILRRLALNVLRSARPDISIRRKQKRSGWSDDFARSVLGQMRQPCGPANGVARMIFRWSNGTQFRFRGSVVVYGLAADDDYAAGGSVALIEASEDIAVLRAVTDYNPQQMHGAWAAARMQWVENHPVQRAGIPVSAAIYSLS